MARIVMWLVLLLPYASLFFLEKSVIRRYISVAFFVTILNVIIYQIAWEYNWWRYKETLFTWDEQMPAHIILGSYWIATIWIFAFTFRKYWLYLAVNIAIDAAFAFIVGPWMQRLGLRSGVLSPLTVLLIMATFANIIYLYQLWYEAEGRTPGREPKRLYVSERLFGAGRRRAR